MNVQKLFAEIDRETDKYIDFLCEICSFEAQAYDIETLNLQADHIGEFAKKEGFSVERVAIDGCGDFLCIDINKGTKKGCVFLAHADTVHKKGAFGISPVKRLADRIIAPGVIDCKGGIAIALMTMRAALLQGYSKHLRLVITTDEEISNSLGGEAEKRFFFEKTEGFPYAVNCETTEGVEVVISRKGILRYNIDIEGVSGHSGINYFSCINPIEEAAHKIIALQSKSERGGITYSCNIVRGGTAINIVPQKCLLQVDVRFPRHCDAAEVERFVIEVANKSFVGGTTSVLQCISKRPPMEKNQATDQLFEKLLRVCKKYDVGTLTATESGGGSDSCYTQMAGVTSICGMGASGAFCHTDKEYAMIESIPLRSKILAAFLADEQ